MYRLPLSFSQAGVGFHKVRRRHSINGVGQMVRVHNRKHVANKVSYEAICIDLALINVG